MASIQKIQTQDGPRWRMRVYVGRDPETGKRKYVTKTFDRKKDADAEATRLERQKDLGVMVVPSKEPLGRYLARWLDDVMRGRVRARTWSDYKGTLRRYILDPPDGAPQIGRIRMDRLTGKAIQSLYAHLQHSEGLSPRTVRSLHAVVRQGLAYATRQREVARNAAEDVVLPREGKRTIDAMSKADADAFLRAARSDRYYALWAVLLTGGLRPGEALGLLWEDVDLEAGRLHVQRALSRRGVEGWRLVPPKTSRGRRVVVLPSFAVQALKSWRAIQAEERLLLGSEYQDDGFVFSTEFGSPLSGVNLNRRNFRRIMAAAELGEWGVDDVGERTKFNPAYRMYDLRHTAATLLLRAGEHPKVVSERLGHSSVAFTLDVYSASLPDMQEDAAEKMEAMLGGA